MNKYVIGIDGMRCAMCEVHVEEAIRRNIPAKKTKASHAKNHVIVITERELIQDDFETALGPTGYRVTGFQRAEAVKGLFGWR